MSRLPWPRCTAGLLAIVLSSSPMRGDAQDVAAAYGSRLAPLPPGEGGDLLLTAPSELCADATHELQLRRLESSSSGNSMLYALRGPAGPSNCEWHVDGLREATYDAVIVRRGDNHIVATAPRTPVIRGGTGLMRLDLAAIEIEGRITVNGTAPPDAQLVFQPGEGFDRWIAPLHEDGTYRVKLDGGDSGRFCIYLERARTRTIHAFLAGCHPFEPGLRRFDADLPVPPGVIRVEVLAFARGAGSDWSSLNVVVSGGQSTAGGGGFRATDGFRGEYIGAAYQEYDVSIQTSPAHRILARSRIALTPGQPIADVRLVIPPGSLSCDEGWWSAC